MASTDEPQNIKIGGAGMVSLLLIPIVIFVFFLAITYIFPSMIPPGNLIVRPQIDPASGQPLSLDPIGSLIVSLTNGVVYGSTAALIEVIYVVRRRVK